MSTGPHYSDLSGWFACALHDLHLERIDIQEFFRQIHQNLEKEALKGWNAKCGEEGVETGVRAIRDYIREHWQDGWANMAGNLCPAGFTDDVSGCSTNMEQSLNTTMTPTVRPSPRVSAASGPVLQTSIPQEFAIPHLVNRQDNTDAVQTRLKLLSDELNIWEAQLLHVRQKIQGVSDHIARLDGLIASDATQPTDNSVYHTIHQRIVSQVRSIRGAELLQLQAAEKRHISMLATTCQEIRQIEAGLRYGEQLNHSDVGEEVFGMDDEQEIKKVQELIKESLRKIPKS